MFKHRATIFKIVVFKALQFPKIQKNINDNHNQNPSLIPN